MGRGWHGSKPEEWKLKRQGITMSADFCKNLSFRKKGNQNWIIRWNRLFYETIFGLGPISIILILNFIISESEKLLPKGRNPNFGKFTEKENL